MKILAIRGCNLASLEGEFEIDFTVEPLKSAGIFAITGTTGSGKSTILDAVCLALFNNTPRISNVERDNIKDVRDTTVTLGDSRNILRRGTGSGYAEVDFVSLSGEKYRSRWSVRRSREKADGSMQAWNLELINLTTNEAQQGGKTELLNRIKELIGLTFDQFTRAVMLAQGDFATFLKASKNEKADLLEKLTGTDIYSRISAKIYENTQSAKSDLDVVLHNIEGVELLSDEQLLELETEVKKIDAEIKRLEQLEKLQSEKIKWIETNELLVKSISSAEELLKESEAAVLSAKPRFDYLTSVDSVQGIRDDFMSLESTRLQLKKNKRTLLHQQEIEQSSNEELAKSNEELEKLSKLKVDAESALKSERPNIIKARSLDIKLEGAKLSLTDAKKEVKATQKQKDSTKSNIKKANDEIDEGRSSLKNLTEWFDENRDLSAIIPKSELILSYIKDATNAKKQSNSNTKLVKSTEKLLAKDSKQLSKWQKEAERLNALLPTEIATLRSRLMDKEPCPVCGSTHHPVSSEVIDSIAEEELTKAKEEAATEIERIKENIKNREGEIVSLKSLVKGYDEQYRSAYQNITNSLNSLTDWQMMFEDSSLTKYITSTVKTWQENESQQTELSNSLNLKEQELKSYSEKLTEIENSLKEKSEKLSAKTKEFGELQAERKQLFNGENIDSVEGKLSKAITDATKKYDTKNENCNNLVAKVKEIGGSIAQMISTIGEDEKREQSLQQNITNWLGRRDDKLSFDELKSLISKDNSWIVDERKALNLLVTNQTEAKATLAERKKNHQDHQKAEVKPDDNESKDALSEAIVTIVYSLDTNRDRVTAINVAVTNHKNGKDKIRKFKKELEQKKTIANNWEKLNGLFGSADGGKFKTIAQGYTLDVLLGYANKHLSDISDRYLLERVSPESLALQVRDLDMLSEVRSVHSLSGGESFLISLALALGLSSLSSNRMRIESLFIDEGFGTLDADTLRTAMDVLESLQTQGRKIGVISHVAEMTERITTQIQVVKKSNGRSSVEII